MRLTKGMKKIVSLALAGAMIITGAQVAPKASAEEATTYDAKLSGQVDTEACSYGEWDSFEAHADFKLGEESTITFNTTDEEKMTLSGNFIGIDTNMDYSEDLDGVLTSVKLDGNDANADLTKAKFAEEGGKARIILALKWGADIDIFKSAVSFNEMKVSFIFKEKEASAGDDTTTAGDDTTTAGDDTSTAGGDDADKYVGVAKLDSQANGWCEERPDIENVKANINGPGTYTVATIWEDIQEDPQAYMAMTVDKNLEKQADFIRYSDVTVWVDGKVVDVPFIYGENKDGRLQLWNTWGIGDKHPAGSPGWEVPTNWPKTFFEVKIQFTISFSETPLDWDADGSNPDLITTVTDPEKVPDYTPEYIPDVAPSKPTTKPSTEPTVKPTVKPTVQPTVQPNPCNKVKAAKKSLSLKKKKTKTLTFKLTNAVSANKTTDAVKVSSSKKKVVKVVKTTITAKKVTVKVKALKKGKSVIKVKVGKKSAKTTVKVK